MLTITYVPFAPRFAIDYTTAIITRLAKCPQETELGRSKKSRVSFDYEKWVLKLATSACYAVATSLYEAGAITQAGIFEEYR